MVARQFRPFVDWCRAIGVSFTQNRASLAAGGLAYFVTLSLAPLAIAFGGIAGLVLDPATVQRVLDSLADKSPVSGSTDQVAEQLISLVTNASAGSTSIATVIGFVVALYAASKVVYGGRMALNTAFGFEEKRAGVIERAIAAVVTLAALVIGVVAVIVITVVPRILQELGIKNVTASTGNAAIDWLIFFVLVYIGTWGAMVFGPSQRMKVPWLSLGVSVSTVIVIASTSFVGIYVHFSSTMSAAVIALGTPVVLLLWLYLCFLGLLLGAVMIEKGLPKKG